MSDLAAIGRRHQRLGWWLLVLWLTLGIALEAMHGFKVSWYLAVGNETRRHLLTLGHAHGTLLALVHLAFAVTLAHGPPSLTTARVGSACLTAASLLLPLGFVLGALVIYGGSDPGPGIFLVPVGAVALIAGVLAAAIGVSRRAG